MENNVATFDFTNLGNILEEGAKTEIKDPVIDIENIEVTDDVEPLETDKPVTEKSSEIEEVKKPVVVEPASADLKKILKSLGIESFVQGEGEEEKVFNIDETDIDSETATELIKNFYSQELEAFKEKSVSVDNVDQDRKEVIDFIIKGGDPRKLIELQTELEDVKQYDLDNEADAEELVRKYYSYKADISKEEVDAIIQGAKAQDSLTKMAENASVKLTEHVDKLKNAEKENLENLVKAKKEALKNYVKEFKTEVKNLGYTDKQYSAIVDFATKPVKRKLNDGTEIEAYEMDEVISIIRNNPKDAVDLALFIKDKPMYLRKAFEKKEIEMKTDLSKKVRIAKNFRSDSADTTKTTFEKNNKDYTNLLPLE